MENQTPEFTTLNTDALVREIAGYKETINNLNTKVSEFRIKISDVKDFMVKWRKDDADLSTVISDLCVLLGLDTRTNVNFEASVTVYGTIAIDLTEDYMLDVSEKVQNAMEVSFRDSDMEVTDFTVDEVDDD
jgi:DNA topoisomerase VI subunit A